MDSGDGGGTVVGSASAVLAAALTQLGVPYRWGMESRGVGFDCSGLVQWAFAKARVKLPRTTSQQILSGVALENLADLRPGDLPSRGASAMGRWSTAVKSRSTSTTAR